MTQLALWSGWIGGRPNALLGQGFTEFTTTIPSLFTNSAAWLISTIPTALASLSLSTKSRIYIVVWHYLMTNLEAQTQQLSAFWKRNSLGLRFFPSFPISVILLPIILVWFVCSINPQWNREKIFKEQSYSKSSFLLISSTFKNPI